MAGNLEDEGTDDSAAANLPFFHLSVRLQSASVGDGKFPKLSEHALHSIFLSSTEQNKINWMLQNGIPRPNVGFSDPTNCFMTSTR